MRIYWIDELEEGKLGIMPRPRGNDWLETEVQILSRQKINGLVSLLEKDEVEELELEQEADLCEKYGISFLNFPIKDRSVPKDISAFISLIENLSQSLDKGNKLVIHCRMGIGRASLLAAGILVKKGVNASKVFELIAKYRTLKVPDTQEQMHWLCEIAKSL